MKNNDLDSNLINRPELLKQSTRNLRRIISNATSILTSNVVIRGTSFFIYALVARYLGAFEFGQLSLSLTLFHTFHIFTVAGLKTLVTREVAKNRTQTGLYLVNASMVVLVFSMLTIFSAGLFVRLMNYAPDTVSIILLLSLGLLPYALSQICEGVIQAWEKMHFIAVANVSTSIAKACLTFLLLWQGYNIYHIVVMIVVFHLVTLVIEWGLIFRYITKPCIKIEPHFSLIMVKSAAPFLGIQGTIAIRSSLSVIVLSKLAGETEVGLYSAANQLMIPLQLIFDNIVISIFPVMCRKFEASLQSLQQVTENLIELLVAIALPAVICLFVLADSILLLLYGNLDFLHASKVLQIVVWLPILAALKRVLGQVLWASQQEKVSLRIAVINTLISFVVGLLFISWFGLIGAAISAALAALINFFQHYSPATRLFPKISLVRLIWKPILAASCMAIYLILMKDQRVFLAVLTASILYAFVLLAVSVWSVGGLNQLKLKYLYVWSE